MITLQQSIAAAQKAVKDKIYIDSENGIEVRFSARADALKAGVKDDPLVRDIWVVDFKRKLTGSPLDGLHDYMSVWVDAETGQTQLIDSF